MKGTGRRWPTSNDPILAESAKKTPPQWRPERLASGGERKEKGGPERRRCQSSKPCPNSFAEGNKRTIPGGKKKAGRCTQRRTKKIPAALWRRGGSPPFTPRRGKGAPRQRFLKSQRKENPGRAIQIFGRRGGGRNRYTCIISFV